MPDNLRLCPDCAIPTHSKASRSFAGARGSVRTCEVCGRPLTEKTYEHRGRIESYWTCDLAEGAWASGGLHVSTDAPEKRLGSNMKKSKIILTMELNCERDISEEHRVNLLMNSLAWVTHRLRKIHENGGPESGNLHHTDGKPYGFFAVSKFDDMDTYKPEHNDKIRHGGDNP